MAALALLWVLVWLVAPPLLGFLIARARDRRALWWCMAAAVVAGALGIAELAYRSGRPPYTVRALALLAAIPWAALWAAPWSALAWMIGRRRDAAAVRVAEEAARRPPPLPRR